MKNLSLCATFLIVGGLSLGASACTLTVSSGDDGGLPGPDAASADGATLDESSLRDSDAQSDAAAVGDGAPTCNLPDGSGACALCLAANCCREEFACDSQVTDGAPAECREIESCYNDCVSPPPDSGVTAATPSDCITACSASHSTQSTADFTALRACAVANCSASCP